MHYYCSDTGVCVWADFFFFQLVFFSLFPSFVTCIFTKRHFYIYILIFHYGLIVFVSKCFFFLIIDLSRAEKKQTNSLEDDYDSGILNE